MLKNKIVIKTNTLYFPAMGGTLQSAIERPGNHKLPFDLSFYNPEGDCPFYYGKLLVSIGPFLSGKKIFEPDIEKILKINRKYVKIFGDSAGYQIATGKIKYSDELRKNVFSWMNNYCDIGLPIDIPPVVTTNAGDTASEAHLKEVYEQSIKNIKWVHERLGESNCLFLNVQHGRDIAYMDHWYKGVKDFTDFQGWAIGSVGSSTFQSIYAIARMFENGEMNNEHKKLYHLFGVSTAQMIPIIMYLQKKIHDKGLEHVKISFDSSTPLLQSAFGNYCISRNKQVSWSYMKIQNSFDYTPFKGKGIKMPCLCPVCSQIGNIDNWLDDELMTTRSRWYSLTALHNLFKMLDFIVGAETMIRIDNKELLTEFFSPKLAKIFNFIDGAFDSASPTKYLIPHRHSIQSTEDKLLRTNKQTRLGDF